MPGIFRFHDANARLSPFDFNCNDNDFILD